MDTKFVFLIPLRNPNTAQNWRRCVEICKSTLASACNQTASTSDYEVVLVCKEFPEIDEYSNLKIIRRDFPNPQKTWEDQHRDKYNKIRCGLEYLSKYESLYIMKLDADDLVSNQTASYVLSDNNKNGYYINDGYQWTKGHKTMKVINNFHEICGSSNILFISGDSIKKENVVNSDIFKLGHNITVETFKKNGRPLSAIPFSAAIYRTNHGENITFYYKQSSPSVCKPNINYYVGNFLKKCFIKRKIITKSIKYEFSI